MECLKQWRLLNPNQVEAQFRVETDQLNLSQLLGPSQRFWKLTFSLFGFSLLSPYCFHSSLTNSSWSQQPTLSFILLISCSLHPLLFSFYPHLAHLKNMINALSGQLNMLSSQEKCSFRAELGIKVLIVFCSTVQLSDALFTLILSYMAPFDYIRPVAGRFITKIFEGFVSCQVKVGERWRQSERFEHNLQQKQTNTTSQFSSAFSTR